MISNVSSGDLPPRHLESDRLLDCVYSRIAEIEEKVPHLLASAKIEDRELHRVHVVHTIEAHQETTAHSEVDRELAPVVKAIYFGQLVGLLGGWELVLCVASVVISERHQRRQMHRGLLIAVPAPLIE